MDEIGAAAALRACTLFAHASDGERASVARRLRRRRFRRDEVIFHEGDPGDALHVVSAGAVKLMVPSVEGEEAILATLAVGDVFGELALLDGQPRSASAVAVGATETLSLTRDDFRMLIDRDRVLRDALLAGLAAALRRTTSQVAELHFLDLAGRLAAHLARMARDREPGADRVTLDWPFTQRELAAMIGGARQSVNRELGAFQAAGLVEMDGDRLIIPSVDALERAAER